ncbi:spike base protein, RCAP_Rcc01079 family [Halodurantibacterium flavum]|uniref:Uncharacterized protein n=1 Tax=Halodurantibacterium flavum TaxID=1382802 RepID=A0ABW4S277_9RHOB
MNPFANRTLPLAGPAYDIVPVSTHNSNDMPVTAVALYVETGGTLSVVTAKGQTRQVAVADFSILPVGVRRVRTTGTTAGGIHALVLT